MSPTAKSGWFDASIAARAERAHDLADPDRRQVGVEGDPAALRRVAGQHQVAHQHLALAGRRRFRLDEIEVAVLDRSVRTAREQPLAVFHGFPPTANGAVVIARGAALRGGGPGRFLDLWKPKKGGGHREP